MLPFCIGCNRISDNWPIFLKRRLVSSSLRKQQELGQAWLWFNFPLPETFGGFLDHIEIFLFFLAAAINYDKGEESIYDVIGTSSTQSTRSVPLNDTPAGSTSDSEVFYDSADNLKQGMTSFLSKLSMESLDSIDSIDATDDDDDIDDVETDGDVHGSDSHVNDGLTQIAEKVLPQPVDGKKYATERIKEFFKSQGIQPSGNVNYEKIDKDFNLKLDPKSDTPAFDALKKFLLHCQ